MNKEQFEWILCPNCKNKTRTQVLKDTVLERFPLFCPKCKHQFLINVREGKLEKKVEITQ